MAKKRKRKLKKSVKRGCGCLILLLALLPAFMIYRCVRNNSDDDPGLAFVTMEPDSLDIAMAERLAHDVRGALRIDTSRLGISIYDLERNCYVYEHKSHLRQVPASCMKLPTAIMAMHYLGVDHEYKSSLYIDGKVKKGCLHGDVYMLMDDDPLIETFSHFTEAIRTKGITQIDGRVYLQLARTDTLRQHPTAKPWDIPYRKVPLLMKGEKHIQTELSALLRGNGITFEGSITSLSEEEMQQHPSPSSMEQLCVISHPLRDVIAPMLIHSSNIKAECVYYHTQHSAAFADSHWGEDFFFSEMCYTDTEGFVINDGSGLSPENRLTADFLVQLMAYAYRREDIRQVLMDEALATPADPVRQGSLMGRMHSLKGRIFCKTGTLTTVGASSLTGYALNESGRWFAFSIINENSPVAESRIFQDKMCKTLVSMP